jgi:hypothetical protein
VKPPFRVVALLALVLVGMATCIAHGSGGNSSWGFVSVHGSQTSQTGKHKR